MNFTPEELSKETDRLFKSLSNIGWTKNDCLLIVPLTLEINTLKKQQDAIILVHSYQTPDIMYGVADFIGDSYGLSVIASQKEAKKIVFCSVHFMGETAKLLNPKKEVLVPSIAGCSLADSITVEDVKALRKKHPDAGFVCYVNTSAAVKAECDVCCTSSNVVQIVEAMPQKDIVFIPDEYMGKNLKKLTSKNIILWGGKCVVHENFSPETVEAVRSIYPDVKILAHTECSPGVIAKVDMAGGTKAMIDYIQNSDSSTFMLVTECGLTDRIRVEHKDKKIVGTCNLCPYMKEISLKNILKALKNPSSDQIITISDDIQERARKTLDLMFELEQKVLVEI